MPPLNEPPWTYKEVNRKVHENFIQYEFPRLAILADSWLLDRRLYNLRSGDYWSVNIYPHYICVKDITGCPMDLGFTQCLNLSQSGLSLNELMVNSDMQNNWISFRPAVSIFHIGAVDIITEGGDFADEKGNIKFRAKVEIFLSSMENQAKEVLGPFLGPSWWREHKFVWVAIPDWGPKFVNRHSRINAETYLKHKRAANQGLKNFQMSMWKKYQGLLIFPSMGHAQMTIKGCHLKKLWQCQFNTQILTAAARLLCHKCALTKNAPWLARRRVLIDNSSCGPVVLPLPKEPRC